MIPFPDKKYNIIYADPAWSFKNYSNKNSNHKLSYPTMTMQDIKDLPVQNIADKDCVLFLWVTDPLLNKQIEVIEAWGFTYKTVGFYWVKENKNQENNKYYHRSGYWTRGNPEICLLATKGKPKRIHTNIHKLTFSIRERHSKKPDIIRTKIVQLLGDLPRIELFARETADGWDSWGNEV